MHIQAHHLCGSWIQNSLAGSSELLAFTGLPWIVGSVQRSHLKTQLGKDPLAISLTWLLEECSFFQVTLLLVGQRIPSSLPGGPLYQHKTIRRVREDTAIRKSVFYNLISEVMFCQFILFFFLEASHYILFIFKRRGLYKGWNTRRPGLLAAILVGCLFHLLYPKN